MKKIVIGIHGLGNKPAAALLEYWWLNAIREGLARIGAPREELPFEFVFWADILHPELQNPGITDPENPQYLDEPYIPGDPDIKVPLPSFRAKLFKYIDGQLDSIFLNAEGRPKLKRVTDKIIHAYFSDLEVYFRDDCSSILDPRCAARHHIQERLQTVLKKYADCDILLIAHSMGSLVAYDVLNDLPEVPINTLVTIGSPLGLPFIVVRELSRQQSRNPELTRPGVPKSIRHRWVNLSDIEDKVAMDHALKDDYTSNSSGISIEDFSVYNDYMLRGERNPHKSFGYLRSPEFARIIDEFLSVEPEQNILSRIKSIYIKLREGIQGSRAAKQKEVRNATK